MGFKLRSKNPDSRFFLEDTEKTLGYALDVGRIPAYMTVQYELRASFFCNTLACLLNVFDFLVAAAVAAVWVDFLCTAVEYI